MRGSSNVMFNGYFLSGRNFDLKFHFSYLHGGHLENVAYFQFFLMFIGFVDHESMEIYTKIVFLTGLEAKILPKT